MTSQPTTIDSLHGQFNSAEYPVLAVVGLAPVHGYDVWRYLKTHLGTVWQMGRSQVYGLLSQMERDGLVRHERVEQANLPARKVFSLTPAGRGAIEQWIREPVRHIRDFRLEFPTKFHFAQARSQEIARELIEDQVKVCDEKRSQIEWVMAGSTSDIERLVFEYRIGVVDATVRWLRGLLSNQ
jgi:PadR family transcriptional regulator, regulatory protein AphA